MSDRHQLRLFIAGPEMFNQRLITTLVAILDKELADNYDLEIINILDKPEAAKEAKIIATPTLVKCHPEPVRKLFGNLTHRQSLIMGLGLAER